MTSSTNTVAFTPGAGTDWVPLIGEISTVITDVNEASSEGALLSASREEFLEILGRVHLDGQLGLSVLLESTPSGISLSMWVVVGAVRGESLQLATRVAESVAALRASGVPLCRVDCAGAPDRGDRENVVRIRHASEIGATLSKRRWSWGSLNEVIVHAECGTVASLSFLSTSDLVARRQSKEHDRPRLRALWATDLLIATPEELSNVAAGRIAGTLCSLPAWQAIERLDAPADLAAFRLGIPVVGGTRRRFPGDALSHSEVADLLGMRPVQLRLGDDLSR